MSKNFKRMSLSLERMIGKKVYVTLNGGWTGYVTDVVDEKNLRVSKSDLDSRHPEFVVVNIFDVRST